MTAASRSVPSLAPDASRYQLERMLGEGGSGVVYLAKDLETGEYVAFKKLLHVNTRNVQRLKREFRALRAVNHPHIIKLYDMGKMGDAWFLAMEYLEGTDLSAYLAAPANDVAPNPCSARLIAAFRQLALGVHALHEAGMLHRDLKPSNVIVSEGRVVVLDFGLVRELGDRDSTITEEGSVAGTPAYMAPEQLVGAELTTASDWYAFGVMLYEAVSGVLPIEGSMGQLLRSKLDLDPPRLAKMVSSAPTWLTDLCTGLLQRDPAARPDGAEVVRQFTAADANPVVWRSAIDITIATESESKQSAALIGRDAELDRLWEALDEAAMGRTVVVHVRAASGAGRTALVEHFVEQLARPAPNPVQASPLVLRSRCYELEAMPYKAIDGLMEALVRHMSRLDDLAAAHLLPADLSALAMVFPMFGQLNASKRLRTHKRVSGEVQEIRKRAHLALRQLLDNLATRSPVVIWIDDLQWGDVDSALILRSWLTQATQSPLLLLLSYRSDELLTSTCLRTLLGDTAASAPASAERVVEHVVELSPLLTDEVRALCELRLRIHAPDRAALIERVIRDAQGSPFIAQQLISLINAKAARGEAEPEDMSLDAMVTQLRGLLEARAQHVLEVLAVAGRPMPPRLALLAAGVERDGRAAVHDLRALGLVRTREVAGARMLEVYHDRIRERIEQTLSQEQRRGIHQRLFDAVVSSAREDPDWLHTLALGSGNSEQAVHYGKIAAERASSALAFERAAALYQVCVEFASAQERLSLYGKLAVAYARAGRGVEAAKAALDAAHYASGEEALGWLHHAASHYLRCGHFAQGEGLVQRVLDAKDIHVPTSDAGLLAAIAWERLRVRMVKKPLAASDTRTTRDMLERYDLLMALYSNTRVHDPLRAALFQTRAMRCALLSGEPGRTVRALCHASTSAAVQGTEQSARASDALFARATELAATLPVCDERILSMTRAVNALYLGRIQQVVDLAAAAEQVFRSSTQDDTTFGDYTWRTGLASARLGALHYCARYDLFLPELHAIIDEASASGDRMVLFQMEYTRVLAEQIEGDVSASRARLDAERSALPAGRFGPLHALHMVAVMQTACFVHDYAWAADYIARAWHEYSNSAIRRTTMLSSLVHQAYTRLLLNRWAAQHAGAEVASVVANSLAVFESHATPLAVAIMHRIRARLCVLQGQFDQAVVHLRQSADSFERVETPHEAARDRFALGVLLGATAGDTMCAAARERMRSIGVVDIDADLRAYYPELTRDLAP